jgi:hypothetical protein
LTADPRLALDKAGRDGGMVLQPNIGISDTGKAPTHPILKRGIFSDQMEHVKLGQYVDQQMTEHRVIGVHKIHSQFLVHDPAQTRHTQLGRSAEQIVDSGRDKMQVGCEDNIISTT